MPETHTSSAQWVAKEEGVVAGLFVAKAVFESLDSTIVWNAKVSEGAQVQPGDEIAAIEGSTRALLSVERTALNFVQRMSGIATMTRRFAEALEGTNTQVLDTRKTIPGFRILDKYAVRTGGGTNHRAGLYDMVLIKENHITIAGGLQEAVSRVKNGSPNVKIEVETTTINEVEKAVQCGVDIIMLDNMSPEMMRKAVEIIDGRTTTEASGNITLENVKEIATTGVDYISVGALTHSVTAFDISQKIINQN